MYTIPYSSRPLEKKKSKAVLELKEEGLLLRARGWSTGAFARHVPMLPDVVRTSAPWQRIRESPPAHPAEKKPAAPRAEGVPGPVAVAASQAQGANMIASRTHTRDPAQS